MGALGSSKHSGGVSVGDRISFSIGISSLSVFVGNLRAKLNERNFCDHRCGRWHRR